MRSQIEKFIFEQDLLSPAQRLENLFDLLGSGRSEYRKETYLSLLALHAIDSVIRDSIKTEYFFYILDDKSVTHLLEMSGYLLLNKDTCCRAAIYLGNAQLIYRFNAAKKFSLYDNSVKQLRLNSWGRSFLSDVNLLDEMSSHLDKIRNTFLQYYIQNEALYKELCCLLLKEITHKSTERIYEINAQLEIKLVS